MTVSPCTARASGLRVIAGLVCLLVSLSSTAAAPQPPIVVLVSLDGVRHDHPDLEPLPAFRRIASAGVRAGRLVPVFPSNTFPGHVSLATGTYPDRHGIVDNHFVDSERGTYRYSGDASWIQAEPLWIAAERQGVPAATYFWVGSESDWHGQGTRYRESPFDSSRPESAKVDRMLEWLALGEAERPRLIMSYWRGADAAGHDHGPESAAVRRQLTAQDAELGRLLEGIDALGLWPRTTLVVVSDHGMTPIGPYLDIAGELQAAGIDAQVLGSAVAQIHLADPGQTDAALAAVRSLEPLRAYRRESLPEGWRLQHPTRTGHIVAVTEPPYVFSRPPGIAGTLRGWLFALGMSFGGHGYQPAHPDMGGIFLAMGRGVPGDLVLPEVQQVDVAATVARLLGIDPPRDSEGRSVPGIGERLLTAPSRPDAALDANGGAGRAVH